MNRIDGISVRELVEQLDCVSIIGDAEAICRDALPLRDAKVDSITMIDHASRIEQLVTSNAVAVVTAVPLSSVNCTQVVTNDVHAVFAAIVKRFRHGEEGIVHSSIDAAAQIDPTASIGIGTRIDAGVVIGPNVSIGSDCHLMPGVVVMEKTTIGDRCTIYPRVVLYEYTRMGNDIQIHAGSVIGAHGFGYRQVKGRHVISAQLGYVEIESSVDIGANVTIDRGTYGVTRIGEGTKIDNLVMIAHNCHIGRHNLICSQVGIAGSCQTGDYVVLAGQVGLADHVTLGDHAVIGAQAGVMEDLSPNQVYLGSPAMPQREQMQVFAVQRRLPEMRRELKMIRRELDEVTAKLAQPAIVAEAANADCDLRHSSGGPASEGENPHCLAFKRSAA